MSATRTSKAVIAAPPLDTVLFWLSYMAEQDFERRGLFPDLREANSRARRGATSLHFLTPECAAELLEVAAALAKASSRGLRTSYRSCREQLQRAIAEASARPAFGQHATCTERDAYVERWVGTKDDLRRELGIDDAGRPWPGEPGGKRWFKAVDARQYRCNVTRYSPLWPELLSVNVHIPRERAAAPDHTEERRKKADQARRNLDGMLVDAEDFRLDLIGILRGFFGVVLSEMMRPKSQHAFTLTTDSVQDIQASFDAITEAILSAEVDFDAGRHTEIAQGYRAQIAGSDEAFQAQLVRLTRSRPELLGGGRL